MSHGNPSGGRSTRLKLAEFARQIAGRLFAGPDAQARARGWTVSPSASGLGRVYRDPRIRLLVPCPRCAGERVGCRDCGGRGRVLPAPAVPAPRPAVSSPRPAGMASGGWAR
jgi:hypothetical protein